MIFDQFIEKEDIESLIFCIVDQKHKDLKFFQKKSSLWEYSSSIEITFVDTYFYLTYRASDSDPQTHSDKIHLSSKNLFILFDKIREYKFHTKNYTNGTDSFFPEIFSVENFS